MSDAWDQCARFVSRHLCKIIFGIVGAGLPSIGAGISWYLSANNELDRLTQQTESRSVSTAQALDSLTAETRLHNEEVMATLNQIEVSIAVLSTQLQERTADWPESEGEWVVGNP